MIHPTPSFPPLFPSVDWWRIYVSSLSAGESREKAIIIANSGRRPRDWMRFDGLSLPIEGGASTLKNRPSEVWKLSEKARPAARKIDATLATLYGATPFFHLLDHIISLRNIIEGRHMASEVCREAFHRIESILGLTDISLIESIRVRAIADTRTEFSDAKPSGILEVLFRKGPEAIFTFIPTLQIR